MKLNLVVHYTFAIWNRKLSIKEKEVSMQSATMIMVMSPEKMKNNPWRMIQLRVNVINLNIQVRKLGFVQLKFEFFF